MGSKCFKTGAVREARAPRIYTAVVLDFEPPPASELGGTDPTCSHRISIIKYDVLDQTEPPEETGLVRLLRVIKLLFQQMLHNFTKTICLHQQLNAFCRFLPANLNR